MKSSFYGWYNVVAVMIVYGGLCGNVTYAYGVFLPSMSEAFQWPKAALSGPYTIFLLIGGLLGPLAGITCARFGARLNIVAANCIAAIGLFGMSQITQLWQVYLFFGLLCGLGIAFGEFIPSTTVINNWFKIKRTLAMGMLFAAGGIGGFVMPPLIGYLITSWGWRTTWIF
ncbi:MAG: MFS transporter, partial [Treponemataceae bacterium]|nr:MFS transporter [Treponemataceae bacterium]